MSCQARRTVYCDGSTGAQLVRPCMAQSCKRPALPSTRTSIRPSSTRSTATMSPSSARRRGSGSGGGGSRGASMHLRLGSYALHARIVQRPGRDCRRIELAGNLDPPVATRQEGVVDRLPGVDHSEADGTTKRMAVGGCPHVADRHAVTTHDLRMEHLWLGIPHEHLHEAALQRSARAVRQHRFPADEACWLAEI